MLVRDRIQRISIHAPHEGERHLQEAINGKETKFQSTLPTRGSDAIEAVGKAADKSFQSTLPTRGSDQTSNRIITAV